MIFKTCVFVGFKTHSFKFASKFLQAFISYWCFGKEFKKDFNQQI